MNFVPVRDFRVNPGKVWRELKKAGKMVVTSNGKPIALMTGLEGRDLEDAMKADAMVECARAVSKIREHARKRGLSKLTMDDINQEIAAARKSL